MDPTDNSAPHGVAESQRFAFASMQAAVNYRRSILAEFGSALAGDVLEVGCGIGHITAELQADPRVTSVTGVEPDPDCCRAFRHRFPSVPLVQGTADDLESAAGFDSLVSVNVLEHIEQDQEELHRYFQILRARKGSLCMLVPARPELYAAIDQDFGHFRRYRREELRAKVESAGFRIDDLFYYNIVGYVVWLIAFKLLGGRCLQGAAVRLFDQCIFPIGAWAERSIARPPIGQSLMLVAKIP